MPVKTHKTEIIQHAVLGLILALALFGGVLVSKVSAQSPEGSTDVGAVVNEDSFTKYLALENTATSFEMGETINQIVALRVENPEEYEYQVVEQDEPKNILLEARDTLQKYNASKEVVEEMLDEKDSVGTVESFVLGTSLGHLKYQLVQIKDHLYRLELLYEESQIYSERVALKAKIEEVEEEKDKLESFIASRDDRFSLFGWLIRII